MANFTVLTVDGEDFINIVEALDGEIEDEQIFQTIICNECGIYQCASGNWVAIRQCDNFIFFIPAFQKLFDEANRGDYAPPYSMRQKGSFWLTINEFARFKKLVPELDRQNSIKRLTKFDLISLYKWDTTNNMFGDFPYFMPLRKNHILAVSELDNETVFDILDRKLAELETATDFEIKPLMDRERIISLFLDDNSITEWKALCKTKDNYELLLGGTFTITAK